MKHILHDWSDESCLKILRPLRDAAGPDTKLVIMDKVLPYTCVTTEVENANSAAIPEVPGYMKPELAAPLTNVGSATAGFPYMASILVRIFLSYSLYPTFEAPLSCLVLLNSTWCYLAFTLKLSPLPPSLNVLLQMMMLGNGQERTMGHFIELFHKAGWKIEHVRQFDALAQNDSAIIAVPI